MFWKKKKSCEETAAFWASDQGAEQGFVDDLRNVVAEADCAALVVCHFQQTKERVVGVLESEGLAVTVSTTLAEVMGGREASTRSGGPVVVVAYELVQRLAGAMPEEHRKGNAVVFMPEVYPTLSRDEALHAFALGWVSTATIQKYVSLASPLMQSIGNEGLTAVLQQLGMGEGERLEHAMLAGALRNVQKKIGKRVDREQSAASQQQWLDVNLQKR